MTMSRKAFNLFICAFAFLVRCIHFSKAGSNETDRLALLQIKAQITKDPFGVLNSWNDSLPVCSWYGVSCGRLYQSRLTVLNLTSSQLTGTISPSIGNLSFLSYLSLQNNSFGGTVPPEIGRLFRLKKLYLSYNSIKGELPSNISKCNSLVVLSVYTNKLVGGIPSELGLLLNLDTLILSINYFTGTIPASLGNLSYLTSLEMAQNSLSGIIPNSLGSLKLLSNLQLDTNKLFGLVPPSIFNLSALQKLTLESNHFEGSLPSDLGNTLPNLVYLNLYLNNFSGSIPPSISNSSNLDTLVMAGNKLRGQVPSLQRLEKLEWLFLFDNELGIGDPATDFDFISSLANSSMFRFVVGNNNFSGTFPKIFCNFSKLDELIIGENKLFGEIPSCIGNLVKLTGLDLRENNLVGAIPNSIGGLRSLFDFIVSDNQLSGHIPTSVGNLTMLQNFDLHGNNIQGQIPPALGNCGNLLGLDFSYNKLSGTIPTEIFQLTITTILDVSNNRLTGPLSDSVGGLVNLNELFVSDNLLSGKIPTTLGSCIELEELQMQGNSFQGVIPDTLASLKSLQNLDLSRNKLSGKMPPFLQGIQLKMLNLSYNDFEGDLPTSGVFSNATGISVVGNSRLCGGLPELRLHKCRVVPIGRRNNHTRMAVLLGISGFLLLVGLVSLYTIFRKKRAKKATGSTDPEKALTKLSYQTLHRATNGFASKNLIGSGTSGVVYKGVLEDVGTVVAIKIFNLQNRGASKSFVTECKTLRNIRHRNLIKVITACSSLDYKGNDFKALVYEYMPNGSLDDWLHSTKKNQIENSEHAPGNLILSQRLEIAIDVGAALDYLHDNSGSSVIHCDLKPSNVLLDKDMMAHVGDFGLAKFLSQDVNSSGATHSGSVGVRGTIGYAPPEYGVRNEVSIQGDVYSYGILVLEMFTGKRPTDSIFREGTGLRDFVKAALSEQEIKIVDHALLQEMETEESSSQIIFEVLISVLEIGLSCSDELSRERPVMSDVVAKLSSIRTKLQRLHTR